MSTWDYQFFDESEFVCGCCGEHNMDHEFMKKLVNLRRAFSKPMIITSGYRCIIHNGNVGGSRHSPHMEGVACDVKVVGGDALRFVSHAEFCGFKGIGVKQSGDWGSRFIHVDTAESTKDRNRPWLWSY